MTTESDISPLSRPTLRQRLRNGIFAVLRGLVRAAFRTGWIEHGQHHASLPGGLYVANHGSWADTFILAILLEKELRETQPDFAVAINLRHRNRRWAKLLSRLLPVFFYDPVKTDAECNRLLAEAIRGGRTLLVQPEGRPTDSGVPLPACDTLSSLLAETEPLLLPLYIEGTMGSLFSAVQPRQFPLRLWPKVTLHLFPSRRLALPVALRGKARTEAAATQLHDLLTEMAFAHLDYHKTLFSAMLASAKRLGAGHIVCEDTERLTLSYRKLLAGSFILGRAISTTLDKDERTVGLMLPNVNGAMVTFGAFQAYGLTAAILNFTAGRANICAAAKTAALKTVVTSRRFITAAELEPVANALTTQGVRMLYLEDLRGRIDLIAKLCGLGKAFFPRRSYERLHRDTNVAFDADSAAVILFTSGSEGVPKGVALSHANLVANVYQLRTQIDIGISDTIFNPLPIFHTSGLTGGYILPLLSGMKTFLYPSPLHYQTIPELIADTHSTILFVTDTFLNGYARYARNYDMYRLRYVFAGAEKLREETRRLWAERFGVRVFEGYGVTETAPVLSFNSPMFNRPGTVGRFVPGMAHTLAPMEGIQEGGRLKVKGPNVMIGYILPEQPGTIAPTTEGWHDTGDIVSVDEDGFITILGRAKRFAKVGGEMVSLAAVETRLSQLWPEHDHAVVACADSRKGEHLVLVTTRPDATRQEIISHFREIGMSELSLPRRLIHTDALPVLGSGKTDYPAVAEFVTSKENESQDESAKE